MVKFLSTTNRKRLLYSSLTVLTCLFVESVKSQTWQNLGQTEVIQGQINTVSSSYVQTCKAPDGSLYLVMNDYAGLDAARMTVKKYVNGNWVTIGQERFGDQVSLYPKLAFAPDGTPYVFGSSNSVGNPTAVWKYNGSSWQKVGNTINGVYFSAGIAVDASGVPYILYRETSTMKVVVMKLNGNTWESIGDLPKGMEGNQSADMAFDHAGVLYAAFRDGDAGGKASMVKLVNGIWEQVGSAGFTAGSANNVRIDFDMNNVPFVLSAQSGTSLNLMKFENGNWQVHTTNIAGGGVRDFVDLKIDDTGNIFVAYNLSMSLSKTIVKKYSGGQWQFVGNAAGIGTGSANEPSLCLAQGGPYVVYKDSGYGNKPIAQRFDGSAWSPIVTFDEIESNNAAPVVAIGKSGTVYAVFNDALANSVSAKKFVNGSWQFVGTRGTKVIYPATGINLAIDDNDNLYVALSESNSTTVNGVSIAKTDVLKCDGTTWTALGDPGSGVQYTDNVDIALNKDGVPFISQIDSDGRLVVKKYNNGTWDIVGSVVSDDLALHTSLVFDSDGIPYVCYADRGTGPNLLTVKRFVEGSWQLVGTRGFSVGTSPTSPDMTFGPDGILYLNYGASGSALYTMKFADGKWQQMKSLSGVSTLPLSNHIVVDGSGAVHLSYRRNADARPMVSRFFNGNWQPATGQEMSVVLTANSSLFYRNNVVALGHGYAGGYVKTLNTENSVPVPVNLQASIGDKKISLQWDAVSQATAYRLYAIDAQGFSTLISQTSGTQYVHSGLTNGTLYRYRVAALIGSQEGVFSSQVSATPFGGSLVFTPQVIKTTTINLSVSASNPASEMSFSNDGNTWTSWEALASVKAWTLPSGDGQKTVFMKLRLGTFEPPAYSVSTVLDQTLPVITGVENGMYYNTNRTISFNEGTASLTPSGGSAATISNNYTVSAEGLYILRVTDAAGNYTQIQFTIDRTAPAKPSVAMTPLNAEGYTKILKPNISGIAEANGKVRIYLDGSPTLLAEVAVTSSGTWSYNVASNLEEKAHFVKVETVDRAGNVGPQSDQLDFIVDATPPTVPTITGISGRGAGNYSKNQKPTVTGKADPGTKVKVMLDSGSLLVAADLVPGTDGTWSYTFTSNLAPGPHDISAASTDAAGNVSSYSAKELLIIDITPPSAPTISGVSGRGAGNYSKDQRPTINGTSDSDAKISVYADNVLVAADVPVSSSSNWSYTFTSDLAAGSHTLTARSTDAAGNYTNTVTNTPVIIDITAPDAPVITGLTNLQNGYTKVNKPTVTGTTEPNATISLFLDDVKITDLTTGNGGWIYTFGTSIPEGAHKLKAVATDRAMNTSGQGTPLDFIVDVTPPEAPSVPTVPGGNGSATNDTTPIFSGTTEPGLKVAVEIDGKLYGPATADESGKWELEINPALDNGNHTVKVTVTDFAGNTSESPSAIILVKTQKPEAPKQLTVPGGNGITNDPSVPISGKATPGITIEVFAGGQKMGNSHADADGGWSFTFNPVLPVGIHPITAVAVDEAGNRSDPSIPIDVTVVAQKIVTELTGKTVPVKTYGDADFSVAASSNNNQSKIIYSSSNNNVATVDGHGLVHITGAGSATITVTQAESTGFSGAETNISVMVNKGRQTIQYQTVPTLQRRGTGFDLNATASTGLPVRITSSNLMVVKAEGGRLEPQGIGRATITISAQETSDIEPATAQFEVVVEDTNGEKVIVNKIITANGDGLNDELQIEGLSNLGEYHIVITTRAGTKVFESTAYPTGEASGDGVKGFKAKIKNTNLPAGTYFYRVDYKEGNAQRHKTGYFVVKY